MREIYQYISQRIHEEKVAVRAPFSGSVPVPPAAPQSTPLDEVMKLKQLLDMGAITQEEFDQKKKQLLGL